MCSAGTRCILCSVSVSLGWADAADAAVRTDVGVVVVVVVVLLLLLHRLEMLDLDDRRVDLMAVIRAGRYWLGGHSSLLGGVLPCRIRPLADDR